MSKKKTRSQRQRAARERRQDAPAQNGNQPARRSSRSSGDGMAVYRSLASPGTGLRLVLIAGLSLYTAAQLVALASTKTNNTAAALAVGGTLCITLFLGSGFIRHYRALYRIRRDDPGAWQPTMRFAIASLAVPLGFGGKPADSRERLLRGLTLLLLLAFAISVIAGGRNR